jgi:hypothetical protein
LTSKQQRNIPFHLTLPFCDSKRVDQNSRTVKNRYNSKPHMGEIRNAYKILARKPEGKRPFRRLWYKWEDNIRRDLREI